MASVIAAIADHWRSSPDNAAVRLTAARYALATGNYLADKAAVIDGLASKITDLIEVQNLCQAEYDGMKQLLADHDHDVS